VCRFKNWTVFQEDVRKHKKIADKAWKVKKNEGRNLSALSQKDRRRVEKIMVNGSESQTSLRKLKAEENSIWVKEAALKYLSRMPAANQVPSSLIFNPLL